MPWADTVFEDWDDCVWQDWSDCEWDKFCIGSREGKRRTPRQYYESHVPDPVEGKRQQRSERTGREVEYEWRWLRYFDNNRWTATTGRWFDNRWIAGDIGWVQYFDDTRWEYAGHPEWWDGTKWVLYVPANGSQDRSLTPIGTWYEDYRPTYVRVTYSNVALEGLRLWDTQQATIGGAVNNAYESGESLAITFGDYDIGWLTFRMPPEYLYVTNIEFGSGSMDLSVLGIWAKGLRPEKFRMKFNSANADVSLKDSNGTEIYGNGKYVSGDEVYLDFAGADINRLVVIGSGDIKDIEFLVGVEKGAYRRVIRKPPPGGLSNVRRPYLEGNPSYVEDNQLYPDVALANARMKTTGKTWPHMKFKQPYRYEEVQKMKYRDELAFPHEEERIPETPTSLKARQILFPEPPALPEPTIPESDPIPEADPIPEPDTNESCPRATKPKFRPRPGATGWIHPGYKCVKGQWVINR